ncbi:TonB-dependent receptor [candidate division KSB1 bacterium]|nr:TonB-dependent receptor [candidate division KSB1 bacterium]
MRFIRTVTMIGVIGLFAAASMGQTLVSQAGNNHFAVSPSNNLVSLHEALAALGEAYQVHFLYEDAVVQGKTAVALSSISNNFYEDLRQVLGDNPLTYEKVGASTIVIMPRESAARPSLPAGGTIKGKVTDENGEALPFANAIIEGTTMGDAADQNGEYVITNVPPGTYTLRTRVVGYKTETAQVTVNMDETVTQDFSLATDILHMDAIVVTGTPGGAGMSKRDASFAITTVEAADIRQFSPSSTANLLELVPGVWSESSGGVAGANIDVRGLPGGGDAPFVTMSINGAPLYGTEMLSFFEQSTIFRVDETVASAEALRGGPNSVFSNGEPGVTMNFTLLQGSDETRARVKYSTSDYNLQRVDAVVSGEVTRGLYYMAGGYAQTSPGVREAQYNAEKGQQFTTQLTKVFDRGVINAFTRFTDDHGQWILPMALNSGNDLGDFAQLGNATRFRELQVNDQGDTEIFDFSRGRGWDGSVSGVNADFDLGAGWTVRDNLSYTKGQANTFGFVPSGGAIRVSALGRTTPVTTQGGRQLSNSDFIQNYGHWVVLKDLESFTNDISLARSWQAHNLTIGSYQASWSAADFWTLGNYVAVHNVANGDILQGIPADTVAAHGGGGTFAFGLRGAGDARVIAFYAAESWQATPALRIDLGARRERIEIEYVLDTGPGYPDGTRDMAVSIDDEQWAFTGAVNYDITQPLGVFGRYSDGFVFPHFDNLRENDRSTNKVRQYEVGLKYAPRKLFSLFATGYFSNYDAFESLVGGGFDPRRFKTESFGVELDGALFVGDLTVRGIATIQSTEITESDDPTIVGNSVLRQPDWQIRLAPNYNFVGKNFNVNLYGAARLVGKRWGDNENVNELDGYEKLDAGVTVSTKTGLSFNLHADNLTDSDGLTEADPRTLAAPNGRPIFGRSVKFSVGYDL